ncbi:DUF2493 domain-containing protein [Sulfobacillus thermosulfidooxidans]|uniref:DUF2493 domain-containing protein n=1 Tax=Sulfobacillus thermosulfidooxidans TaxID=28034 RepID=UPI0006B636FD|nr:DUF2493 domain-containing protein [Sulfobacillus thermosulfidooxidans]
MPLRIVICGSRHWTDTRPIVAMIQRLPPDATLITGGAPGADTLARQAAQQRGLSVEVYPADWARWGRSAGPRRNRQMLATGVDMVIAFRLPGHSPGTDHMMTIARQAGIPVFVIPAPATVFGFRSSVSDDPPCPP